jgi:hypothetical protein
MCLINYNNLLKNRMFMPLLCFITYKKKLVKRGVDFFYVSFFPYFYTTCRVPTSNVSAGQEGFRFGTAEAFCGLFFCSFLFLSIVRQNVKKKSSASFQQSVSEARKSMDKISWSHNNKRKRIKFLHFVVRPPALYLPINIKIIINVML